MLCTAKSLKLVKKINDDQRYQSPGAKDLHTKISKSECFILEFTYTVALLNNEYFGTAFFAV